jgi:Ca2+-binding RTX toxin-like protein
MRRTRPAQTTAPAAFPGSFKLPRRDRRAQAIYGIGGNDTICAGTGDDRVFGGRSNDAIFGERGSDDLYDGAGADRLLGETGNDRIRKRRRQRQATIGGAVLYPDAGSCNAGRIEDSVEKIEGSPGPDILVGNDQANTLPSA